MRNNIREKIQQARARKADQPTSLTLPALRELLVGGPPNPTQLAFWDDPYPDKAYMGAAGVAKTSTISANVIERAVLQPNFQGLVMRHDANDLKGTTLQRIEQMIGRLPAGVFVDRDKDWPYRIYLRCFTDDSISTIMFMGLKERVSSYEFNGVFIDEVDECDEKLVADAKSRLRAPGGNYTFQVCFNPPDKNHWLYKACTGRDMSDKVVDKPWLKLFRPLPKENAHNLPPTYYEDMAKGMAADMQERLIQGEWGAVFAGAPVFPQYAPKLHNVHDIEFDPTLPLIRFWDFGFRHPVCLFSQIDDEGRLKLLDEEFGSDIEIVPFIQRVKAKTRTRFPKARSFLDFGDPAAQQKKDTGSTLERLASEGIELLFIQSTIEEGVARIRLLLERVIRGEMAIQFDAKRMQYMQRVMRGGYHMDKWGRKPVKDGVYDHGADTLRYGVVNLFDATGAPLSDIIKATREEAPDLFDRFRAEEAPVNKGDSLEYDPSFDQQ